MLLIAITLGGLIAWLLVRKLTYRLNMLSNAADSIACLANLKSPCQIMGPG